MKFPDRPAEDIRVGQAGRQADSGQTNESRTNARVALHWSNLPEKAVSRDPG